MPATISVIAAPLLVSPVAAFTPRPRTPPTTAMIPPAVGDTELAITSLSRGTTCGSEADSEDRKKRLTPSTSSTATYSGGPRSPEAMRDAVSATNTERMSAAYTRICLRRQRSMNTPANGPISEYGAYRTANAAAPLDGLGNVAALKKTYVPRPAVKMPSPAWEMSRVLNSRRNPGSSQTTRRSWTKDARRGAPTGRCG